MRGHMVQKYQPLDLVEQLQAFRSQQFTGLLCLQSDQAPSDGETGKYFVSFLLGEINYVSTVAPGIDAIAEQLTENLDHPFFKMGFRIAREQSKGSESPREVLSKVISTRIATWEKVEGAMQSQAEATLRQIAQAPGVIESDPNAGSDLCFGDDRHCLDWAGLQKALENPETPAPQEDKPPLSVLKSSLQDSASLAAAPATGAPTQSGVNPAAGLPTILSVDDSPIVQKMIQRALSQECNVLLANNALLALQTLNKVEQIDLILLDVNMPGISGLDFCRTLRGIPKFKNLPVIMLTANEGRVSKAMGQIAGSTLYLTKPVDDQKLVSVIRQYTQAGGADAGPNDQASLSAV